MKIGTFIQDQSGTLTGRIHGLGFGATSVVLDPQKSRGGKEYYRLIADPLKDVYEIGVAFPKQKDGKEYLSVSIDSPAFAAPINAALFPDLVNGTIYNLIWNRSDNPSPNPRATPGNGPNRFGTPRITL